MVTDEALRLAFAQRLQQALTESKIPSRGSAERIREAIIDRSFSGEISSNATRKWLKGESLPGLAHLHMLCEWLGIRESWLLFGEEPMRPFRNTHHNASQDYQAAEGPGVYLVNLESPRSQRAIERIIQSARHERLTESDMVLLEQIANRIAAQPAPADNIHNNTHERLKDRLDNDDSSTER